MISKSLVILSVTLLALAHAADDQQPQAAAAAPSTEEGRQLNQPLIPAQDSGKPKLNVLEVLKGMGQAIQLLISQHKHQVSFEGGDGSVRINVSGLARAPKLVSSGDAGTGLVRGEGVDEDRGFVIGQEPRYTQGGSRADLAPASSETKEMYRQQAERLRSEINRRSGQLQKVVGAAIEALKDRGDVVVRRVLENLNARLGQAKARADKILGEPEAGELAVRTLNTINQGLNNLNALVQHVLSRVNISINVDVKDMAGRGRQEAKPQTPEQQASNPQPSPPLTGSVPAGQPSQTSAIVGAPVLVPVQ